MTAAPVLVRFTDLANPLDAVHVMRFHSDHYDDLGSQVRDHAMAACCEAGIGELVVGDRRLPVAPGTLRLVPADCPHVLISGDGGLIETQVLITDPALEAAAQALAHLGTTLPPGLQGSSQPSVRSLAADEQRILLAQCEALRLRPTTAAGSLALVLAIAAATGRSAPTDPYGELPAWLRSAVIKLRSPALLVDGPRGLARLSGRNLDHVNRTLRRCRGITATDLVNELRMELAGAQLLHTASPVREIAAVIGITNLSHFYRLFRRHYGCTPDAWRQGGGEPVGRIDDAPP